MATVHHRTLTDRVPHIDFRSRPFLHACALHTTYLDRKSEFTLPTLLSQVILRFDILCSIAAIISVVHFVHKQGTQGTTFGSNKGRFRWRNILLGEVANNGVNKLAPSIAFWAHSCRLLDPHKSHIRRRCKYECAGGKQYPIILGGEDRCCLLWSTQGQWTYDFGHWANESKL